MEYCGGGSLQDIYHGKSVVCFENIHPPFFFILSLLNMCVFVYMFSDRSAL